MSSPVSSSAQKADSKWSVLQTNLNRALTEIKLETQANNKANPNVSVRFDEPESENDKDGISISEFSFAPVKPSSQMPKNNLKLRRKSATGRQRLLSFTSQEGSDDTYLRQYLAETEKARISGQTLRLPTINKSQVSPISRTKHTGMFDFYYTNFSNLQKGIQEEEEKVFYEPTYRTEPKEKIDQVFIEDKIKSILFNFVQNINTTQTMSSRSSVKSSMENLTTTIKNRMKKIIESRYKIVVNCTVIESKYQGVIVASKCLLDFSNDIGVTVKEYKNNYAFIVNFFAIYHE